MDMVKKYDALIKKKPLKFILTINYPSAQFQFGFAPPVSIPPELTNYPMASTSPNQITHQNQPQMQVFNFLESVSSPVATIKKYVQGTSFPFHSTEVHQCKSYQVGQSQGLANFGPCISRFPVNFNMRQALNRSFFSLPLSEAYSSSNNRKSLWTPVPGLPSSQHSLISNDCSTGRTWESTLQFQLLKMLAISKNA